MKLSAVVTPLLLVAPMMAGDRVDYAKEGQAIRHRIGAYFEALRTEGATSASRFHTDAYDAVAYTGTVQDSLALYEGTVRQVRFLRPDLALADGSFRSGEPGGAFRVPIPGLRQRRRAAIGRIGRPGFHSIRQLQLGAGSGLPY